jgi:hydrogenase-4 component E
MSVVAVLAVLFCGIAVAVVRRRTVAIGFVGAQALILGLAALHLAGDRSTEFLVAAVVLLVKAAVLPLLLLAVVRGTPKARLVAPAMGGLARLTMAGGAVLLAVILVPPLGLASELVEQMTVALVLVGVAIVIMRRPAFFQLLGLIVAENGVSLLAVAAHGGLPFVIELGALFDLAVIVAVAAAFTHRIHGELGTGDTDLLRGLRD